MRLHVASLASAAETADGAESTETVRDDSGRQSQLPTEFREIAEITNTHGVRGEVRVRPMTDFPQQRLETPGRRYVREKEGGRVRPVKLKRGKASVSKGHQVHILKFEGYNNPEEAFAGLVGCMLLVDAADRPPLQDDEDMTYYVQDLIGMHCINLHDGTSIGRVVDVFSGTGTYDVMQVEVIEGETKGGKLLIPFAREIVPQVDLVARELRVDPPPGLLELVKMPKAQKSGKQNGKRRTRNDDVRRLKALREAKRAEQAAEAEAEGEEGDGAEQAETAP